MLLTYSCIYKLRLIVTYCSSKSLIMSSLSWRRLFWFFKLGFDDGILLAQSSISINSVALSISFDSLHHYIADKQERYYICTDQEKTEANNIPLWVIDILKHICDKNSAYADNLYEKFCEAKLPSVTLHNSIIHSSRQYEHDVKA